MAWFFFLKGRAFLLNFGLRVFRSTSDMDLLCAVSDVKAVSSQIWSYITGLEWGGGGEREREVHWACGWRLLMGEGGGINEGHNEHLKHWEKTTSRRGEENLIHYVPMISHIHNSALSFSSPKSWKSWCPTIPNPLVQRPVFWKVKKKLRKNEHSGGCISRWLVTCHRNQTWHG